MISSIFKKDRITEGFLATRHSTYVSLIYDTSCIRPAPGSGRSCRINPQTGKNTASDRHALSGIFLSKYIS
jgi:hypothetical protein